MLKDPKDQQPSAPVTIRREKKVVLGLVLSSSSYPIGYWDWKGIQLPQTGSVKLWQQMFSGKLLKLSIEVLGCSTGTPKVQPCDTCWGRERRSRTGNPNFAPAHMQPYMIDFKAEKLITVLSRHLDENCLKADVTFYFTCVSNHHGGTYRQGSRHNLVV